MGSEDDAKEPGGAIDEEHSETRPQDEAQVFDQALEGRGRAPKQTIVGQLGEKTAGAELSYCTWVCEQLQLVGEESTW